MDVKNTLELGLKGILACCMLSLLAACGTGTDDDSDGDPTPSNVNAQPWKTPILMGNFSINSGDVVTNEDGVSVDYLADYVNASSLPQVEFEYLTINAYVPTTDDFSTTVTGVNVQMHDTSNSSSGNIYYDEGSEFVGQQTLGGTLYSIYRVAALYDGSRGPFTPSNFANIVFTLQISYKSGDVQAGSRTSKLEVYKR